ncbi:MAG TPA: capsular biosynthesis protein [Clostridiaceae bacterium]
MDIKAKNNEKLEKLLFLELSKEKVQLIFDKEVINECYFPLKYSELTSKVSEGDPLEELPVSLFIEGMFYLLGLDPDFKYAMLYKEILSKMNSSISYIKFLISKEVEEKSEGEALILIKGLLQVEKTMDNYKKAFLLSDALRLLNNDYEEEELMIIEEAEKLDSFPEPYFYKAMVLKDKDDYAGAYYALNEYMVKGGEKTSELLVLKNMLQEQRDYSSGKELAYTNPKEALKLLLPLLDTIASNAILYFYIGVAYRVIENYEKAIYYLDESVFIDNELVEVVNELGINYACLGEYATAVSYLRKAFESTKSVEICTNLIMCYIDMKDIEKAKVHLALAKKLSPKDEVVLEIEKMLG